MKSSASARPRAASFGQIPGQPYAIPDQTYFKTFTGAQKGISYNFQAISRKQLESRAAEMKFAC